MACWVGVWNVFSMCASVHSSHTCSSKHLLMIFTKSWRLYKVFLPAWSFFWMKVTKLTSFFKKKKSITADWNSASLNVKFCSKGFALILKNSLKIGFVRLLCLFFPFFSCCSSCCGNKVPLFYWAWMSMPCPPVLGSMGVSKGGLCAGMGIPGCDEGPPCISMAWWEWWAWSGRYPRRGGPCRRWAGWEVIWWGLA